jgi:hypothetical protein
MSSDRRTCRVPGCGGEIKFLSVNGRVIVVDAAPRIDGEFVETGKQGYQVTGSPISGDAQPSDVPRFGRHNPACNVWLRIHRRSKETDFQRAARQQREVRR